MLFTRKFPPGVQLAAGVTPLVFETVTLVNVFGVPVTEIAPLPPKMSVPVLEKLVPASLIVCVAEGLKLKVPLVLTVPLLVNDPLKVCVALPPLKDAPDATLNAVVTVQPTLLVTPPVLLIFTVAIVGLDVDDMVGEIVPL